MPFTSIRHGGGHRFKFKKPECPATLCSTLDGGQETPPNDSAGEGFAILKLSGDHKRLKFFIKICGLSSPLQGDSHFHNGAVGVKGPSLREIDFIEKDDCVIAKGVWLASDSENPLTPTMVAILSTGLMYINVHTENFSGGEVRGQILLCPCKCGGKCDKKKIPPKRCVPKKCRQPRKRCRGFRNKCDCDVCRKRRQYGGYGGYSGHGGYGGYEGHGGYGCHGGYGGRGGHGGKGGKKDWDDHGKDWDDEKDWASDEDWASDKEWDDEKEWDDKKDWDDHGKDRGGHDKWKKARCSCEKRRGHHDGQRRKNHHDGRW